ncbi:MAG: exodeoxyribonuclease VII small subunit [Eubacteriales bacterium]|nr:exodeoxyribonuclease VII small subunit [Clostridiales bacterium]MDD6341124.1 exodeoxyribonuclease VII small subunit [Eubacteriales bacterium]MDD7394140.1 exodeoxyribonuclease VII small subunit [Eubacteriales bacterium]MDY3759994.1 exodeoxyribonuclease VII small subunit [Eubacteriales bacterium]
MTYEQAVGRLEEIAGLMESGKLSLDESMKLYDESVRLTEFCYSKLEAFKQRVYEVTSSGEKEIAQND